MKSFAQPGKKFVLTALFISILLSASISFGEPVLGSLRVENDVSIVSAAGTLPVENVYAYFSGDKIITGESAGAGLSLNQDGTVYVGENTYVTVKKWDGDYLVELDKGTVAFSFEQDVPFKFRYAGAEVDTVDRSQRVSGLVYSDENGKVIVHSFKGKLSVREDSGTVALISAPNSFTNLTGHGEQGSVLSKLDSKSSIFGVGNPPLISFVGGLITVGSIIKAMKDDTRTGSPSK